MNHRVTTHSVTQTAWVLAHLLVNMAMMLAFIAVFGVVFQFLMYQLPVVTLFEVVRKMINDLADNVANGEFDCPVTASSVRYVSSLTPCLSPCLPICLCPTYLLMLITIQPTFDALHPTLAITCYA